MEWKQYGYAGNTLVPRWGHSVTYHDPKLLIYGGRASHGYYNTIDIIETTKELIELKPEEQYKEKQKRKYEEKNKTSEALGNLQTTAVELTELTNHLGEQLLIQKKAIQETKNAMLVLLQENESLKQQLQRLAPDYFLHNQPQPLPPQPQFSAPPVNHHSSPIYKNHHDSQSWVGKEENPPILEVEKYPEDQMEVRQKEKKTEETTTTVGNSGLERERTSGGSSSLMSNFGAGTKLHVFPPPPSPVYSVSKVETVTTNDSEIIYY